MYELKGAVGKGKANFGDDVAFVQFAMKIFKNKKGASLYAGKIDGKYDDSSLGFAIEEFANVYGGLRSALYGYVSNLISINRNLPSLYKQYNFHFLADVRMFLLSLKSAGNDTNPYNHAVLTMPNKEAKQLVRLIGGLARVYKTQATIRAATVSPAGKIFVSFTLAGGLAIDNQTGKIVALSKVVPTKKFAKIVATRAGRGQLILWENISNNEYALGTVSKIPYAEKKGSKTGIAWILGWKDSRKARNNPIVERCLEIYSQVRVLEKPDATKIKLLQECFGEHWAAIQNQEDAHKFLCSSYTADLRLLIAQRNTLLSRYVLAQNRLASLGFSSHSEGDILMAMAIEATGFLGGKAANIGTRAVVSEAFKKAAKNNARKGTLKLDTFKKAKAEAKARTGNLADKADNAVAIPASLISDIDAVDAILIVASVATMITAGTILGPIVLTLGFVKTAFDVYDAREKLLDENQEVQEAVDTVDRIRNALRKQVEEIQARVYTMDINNCFISIKDYDFTAQDISTANSELAKLGVKI